jgi:nucleotidyltransferase/DNA polymerase involved in DNA repair
LSSWIACVVIEYFAAGVMRQRRSSLAKTPLILVQYGEKRAKVVATSGDAVTFGVHPGMTLSRARGFCPQGQFVSAEPQQDERALSRLLEILWTFSNRVEVDMTAFPQSAVCYVDLGSLHDLDVQHLANEMLHVVTQGMRLSVKIGVAKGKLAAQLAAQHEDRPLIVPRGTECSFISSFPVDHLPLAKDAKHRLSLLGLRQIGQFANLPSASVLAQFGKSGQKAHQLARGLDGRPVIPKKMPPTEAAAREFEDPLSSALRLERIFYSLSAELEKRLDGRVSAVHEMVLILNFADGSQQHECLHLLEPVSIAKNIERVLSRLMERFDVKAGIVRIEVQLAHLVSSMPRQLELFTSKPARQQLLDLTQVLAERYQQVDFWEPEVTNRHLLALERRVGFRRVSGS